MKFVALIGLIDEADCIGTCIDYHLAIGFDHIVVTDIGSTVIVRPSAGTRFSLIVTPSGLPTLFSASIDPPVSTHRVPAPAGLRPRGSSSSRSATTRRGGPAT